MGLGQSLLPVAHLGSDAGLQRRPRPRRRLDGLPPPALRPFSSSFNYLCIYARTQTGSQADLRNAARQMQMQDRQQGRCTHLQKLEPLNPHAVSQGPRPSGTCPAVAGEGRLRHVP